MNNAAWKLFEPRTRTTKRHVAYSTCAESSMEQLLTRRSSNRGGNALPTWRTAAVLPPVTCHESGNPAPGRPFEPSVSAFQRKLALARSRRCHPVNAQLRQACLARVGRDQASMFQRSADNRRCDAVRNLPQPRAPRQPRAAMRSYNFSPTVLGLPVSGQASEIPLQDRRGPHEQKARAKLRDSVVRSVQKSPIRDVPQSFYRWEIEAR